METCWNCGARIQPADPNAPAEPNRETPDWLESLRDSSESNQHLPGEEPAAEAGDIPDWLASIRPSDDRADQEAPAQDDWLSSLTQDPSAPATETPDWLKGEETSPAVGGDWMNALQDSQQPAQPAGETPQPEETEDDWLKNLASWQTPSAQQNALADELSAMPAETAADPPAADEPSFDWQSLTSDTPADVTETQPESSIAEPAPAEPADLPDWLASLPTEPESEPTAASDQTPTFTSWLRELPAEPAEEPAAETPIQPFADLPDWLSENPATAAEPAEAAAEPPGAAPAQPFADLPDWLSQIPGADAEIAPQPLAADQPDLTAPLPPFFDNLENQPAADDAADSIKAAPFTLNDEEPPAPEQVGDMPEWLKTFSANLQPEEQDLPALDAQQALEESVAPFEGGTTGYSGADLPDWLNAADESVPAVLDENPEETESSAALETAQLPGWLQAMRPVESVISENTAQPAADELTERAGPLAGLVGALPGENLVTKYHKLPPYSARLQVSERQRLNADLIEEMLTEDTRAKPARSERSHLPQRLIRAMIALAFLLVLLFPLVSGTQIMPMPDLYPPEMVAFHSLVEQLPAGAPVLLAVDYEPGLSGEMQLASSAVVDHLMARNARLAVVSTVPVGPVLADTLLREANAARSDYALSDLAVNLGFLPGGTAGLQEFASRPQAAMPYTHDGKRMAWSQPALAGVGGLNQFSLVIVLTENAETARAWIEQAQPSLDDVPLLFVSSAQTAPFLQPYLDSGQVQAMVSGMAGGSIYAQITRQPNLGRTYWDAYQFGIFLAVLLVLLGGLIALFAPIFNRRAAGKRN